VVESLMKLSTIMGLKSALVLVGLKQFLLGWQNRLFEKMTVVYTIGGCFSFRKLRTLKRNVFLTLKISVQRMCDDPTIFEMRKKSNRNL
jgi:hypothetical protein